MKFRKLFFPRWAGGSKNPPAEIRKDRIEAAERVLHTLREQANALEVEANIILRKRKGLTE